MTHNVVRLFDGQPGGVHVDAVHTRIRSVRAVAMLLALARRASTITSFPLYPLTEMTR